MSERTLTSKPTETQRILRERFGFDTLRAHQKGPIDQIMAGRNALAVMPTGSGKSLCYQLPALARRQRTGAGTALVLSPLIALMEDQVAALRDRGIRAAYINSTLGRKQREDRQRALAQGQYELIYATPERMHKQAFREALDDCPGAVTLLAVDEAHCISQWGHDLRPAYAEVGRFRRDIGSPPTIALTATATAEVRRDIRRVLQLDERNMPLFFEPLDRPNLTLDIAEVWSDADKLSAITDLVRATPGTVIVYFALIKDLERFAAELRPTLTNRRIELYHGRLDPKQKKRISRVFDQASPNENLLLLATNAFGMGVDKPDIRAIIHAQLPGSVEAYYQEVGRAGRDGQPSRCLLLYAQDDLAIQQQFATWQNPPARMLAQLAHTAQHSPHEDFDAEEIRLESLGKRAESGQVDYALIELEKLGVIEPTSVIGRYRFARPLDAHEVDDEQIDNKRTRDLTRLLRVVEMTKADELQSFVLRYFAD